MDTVDTSIGSSNALDDLLTMARSEPGPARLLTLLLRAEPVVDRNAGADSGPAESGLLKPIAVKAHVLDDISDGSALLADVEGVVQSEWHFLMVGVLPGSLAGPPSPDLTDEQLKNMARSVHTGSGMDRYAFFDRHANPVLIGPPS